MAHWAELDDSNTVIRVLVGNNDDANEGYDWLIENLGGRWVKTSYNSRAGKHWAWGEWTETKEDGSTVVCYGPVDSGQPHLRYNFAGPGFLYDPIRDAFIPPKPEGDWVLDEATCQWVQA